MLCMRVYKLLHAYLVLGYIMVVVYMFEASIIKMGNRYYIYPPKQYQDRIARLHGKKVKILLLHEEDTP
ncbi:MAG: hypothetical protein DRN15_05995 [Thermoprotei archaeon]|nr:MAG: hypothetical protein DRN15_05995 [Thermoprotei archaeon]RLF25017.1 MAG: hypothetical protein DRM97_02630 [Thermoprotei archaeon]